MVFIMFVCNVVKKIEKAMVLVYAFRGGRWLGCGDLFARGSVFCAEFFFFFEDRPHGGKKIMKMAIRKYHAFWDRGAARLAA